MIPAVQRYLSLAQIAERWGVHPHTARKMLAGCPTLKLGRLVRYPLDGVEIIEARMTRETSLPAGKAKVPPAPPMDAEEIELRRRYGR
jgi:hypothetical protein